MSSDLTSKDITRLRGLLKTGVVKDLQTVLNDLSQNSAPDKVWDGLFSNPIVLSLLKTWDSSVWIALIDGTANITTVNERIKEAIDKIIIKGPKEFFAFDWDPYRRCIPAFLEQVVSNAVLDALGEYDKIEYTSSQDRKQLLRNIFNLHVARYIGMAYDKEPLSDFVSELIRDTNIPQVVVNNFTSMSDQAALNLSKYSGELDGAFGGMKSFPDSPGHLAALQKVAEANGSMRFPYLTEISIKVAEIIAKTEGEVELGGGRLDDDNFNYIGDSMLDNISDAVAEILSHMKGFDLHITARKMSEQAAISLAKVEAGLGLHVQSLQMTVNLAKAIAARQNMTFIPWKAITSEVAEILSKQKGNTPLYLDDLESLSDECAEHLFRHEGMVALRGLKSISERALSHLKQKENVWLA